MADAKHYLISIQGAKDYIFLTIFDEKTQKLVKNYEPSTVKEFFKIILKYKAMLKAAFLNVFMLRTSEYKNGLEACKAIRNFLEKHSIPSHFYSCEYWLAFNIVVAANVDPFLNDILLTVNVGTDQIILGFRRFTTDGYKTFGTKNIGIERLENTANCFIEIVKKFNMKKMVLFSIEKNNALLKNFEKLLRSNKNFDFADKLIVVDYEKLMDTTVTANSVIQMSKWFFDRSYIKYYFVPQIPRTFEIWGVIGDTRKKLLTVEPGDPIPFTKSIIFNKSVQTCLMYNVENKEFTDDVEAEQKCHQRKLTFTIESECFPEIKIEPITFPEIECLRKNLDKLQIQIPVIGFFRNSSVICVPGKNGYQFLDSWNGVYGNELFINFEEEKPKFGMSSIKANETKMTFVVYDLIKIMSMQTDKITVIESLKFKFTKDAENPILIEFDNFDGTKKAASPAFLMAMLLKEKIKLIKNEMKMKEKPKEIGFCFFDQMTSDEMKRVENGLEEACEMLKMKCKFIAF